MGIVEFEESLKTAHIQRDSMLLMSANDCVEGWITTSAGRVSV